MSVIRVDDDLRGDTWAARVLPRRPRWLHQMHAFLLRYFWLPCPMCARYFGGHETGGGLYPDEHATDGSRICLDCARDGTVQPSGILTVPRTVSEEQMQELAERFERARSYRTSAVRLSDAPVVIRRRRKP